ncbi:MAG: class I SAM-dependent methyltransferase [Spirochaetes bacterium]|nr:class I SAM-dependent methyltransferase [Spirochaetota bacterium]
MNKSKYIINKLNKIIYRIFKTRKVISFLKNKNCIASKALVNSIEPVFKNKISAESKIWINKIEAIRHELDISEQEMYFNNFGAGTASSNYTSEEMYEGRVTTNTIGKISRKASKSYKWALLLFKLVREFKPSVCLELGTCLGISTAYQAAALELNNNGKIITLEGDESLAKIAMQNFERLELNKRTISIIGRFQDNLDEVLNKYKPIDFAFIDGHHDEHATINYFNQIFPFLSKKAVLVFDDISWSKGMERAWDVIKMDKRIKISVDMFQIGICCIMDNQEEKQNFKIALS